MDKTRSQDNSEDKIIKDFEEKKSFTSSKFVVFLTIILIFGIFTGYILSRGSKSGIKSYSNLSSNPESLGKGAVIGSDDLKTFKDSTEGVLKEGGIEGEGQFHLVRPGGDSQNVYLISSLVDLSKFIDRKIRIWGQTQKAQTAPWLLEVGRVEILE